MYSLYRAWFGTDDNVVSNSGNVSGNSGYPLTPADTVVRVGNDGEYHFVAHRAVLTAHSGYIKALLAATESDVSQNNDDNPQPTVTTITIPSTIGKYNIFF